MASKTKATAQKEEAPEKETSDSPDSPLLDMSDAAVRKMVKLAKKRGWVTHDEINAVLPSEEVSSDQIEDIFAMLNEMGINVVDQEEAEAEAEAGDREAEEEEDEPSGDTELVEVAAKPLAVKETKEPSERTDDPVRMYLREMGSVELLSREGEIAIAKRIEAGREAMIAGLCESPLTFQAIIIWRDELNEGKVFLRDIIDLEATYAGPDGKVVANPAQPGAPVPGNPVAGADGSAPPMAATPMTAAPPAAPPGPTPFKAAPPKPATEGNGEETDEGEAAAMLSKVSRTLGLSSASMAASDMAFSKSSSSSISPSARGAPSPASSSSEAVGCAAAGAGPIAGAGTGGGADLASGPS